MDLTAKVKTGYVHIILPIFFLAANAVSVVFIIL